MWFVCCVYEHVCGVYGVCECGVCIRICVLVWGICGVGVSVVYVYLFVYCVWCMHMCGTCAVYISKMYVVCVVCKYVYMYL